MTYDPRAPYGHLSGEGQPSTPPPKSRTPRWLTATIAIAVLVVAGLAIAIISEASGEDDETPAPAAAERPTTTDAPTTTALPYRAPKPEDFSIAVVILEKQCFGSAGCNVTFTVELTINTFLLDPDTTYQVIYEVTGGEDGPATNNLEVTGDSYEYQSEDFISTPSNETQLTATVTSVREL